MVQSRKNVVFLPTLAAWNNALAVSEQALNRSSNPSPKRLFLDSGNSSAAKEVRVPLELIFFRTKLHFSFDRSAAASTRHAYCCMLH